MQFDWETRDKVFLCASNLEIAGALRILWEFLAWEELSSSTSLRDSKSLAACRVVQSFRTMLFSLQYG
jgi:hypothetical protein